MTTKLTKADLRKRAERYISLKAEIRRINSGMHPDYGSISGLKQKMEKAKQENMWYHSLLTTKTFSPRPTNEIAEYKRKYNSSLKTINECKRKIANTEKLIVDKKRKAENEIARMEKASYFALLKQYL